MVWQGRGAPVVLSHALGLDLHLWDQLAPALSASNEVLRYDHRGHGQSAAPVGPYTMDDLVDECEAGDLGACDDLYAQSDVGSNYERYGRTCGGRLPASAADDVPGGVCAERYGDADA